MIKIINVLEIRHTQDNYATWENSTDKGHIKLRVWEASYLIRKNVFKKQSTDNAEAWIFKEAVKITAVTRYMNTNGWVMTWESPTDRRTLNISEAEGNLLVVYNNFDKSFTDISETWVFKEVPLPVFLTGLNPNTETG